MRWRVWLVVVRFVVVIKKEAAAKANLSVRKGE